jgi:lipopolysaccharide/colanic/teichoic acid biosynthesis glycosyltransferase
MSLVGPPGIIQPDPRNGSVSPQRYLGKAGLTGLAQIHENDGLTPEEVERYNLYYAKNQSLWLDVQILVKSIHLMTRR